jgi:hypothetical protein
MSPFLIPIVAILSGTTLVLVFPLVRAYARKLELEGQQPRVPREVADRLARMEQAIDAVAVEVERIAEAQRFTTRLLSERAGVAGGSLPSAERALEVSDAR